MSWATIRVRSGFCWNDLNGLPVSRMALRGRCAFLARPLTSISGHLVGGGARSTARRRRPLSSAPGPNLGRSRGVSLTLLCHLGSVRGPQWVRWFRGTWSLGHARLSTSFFPGTGGSASQQTIFTAKKSRLLRKGVPRPPGMRPGLVLAHENPMRLLQRGDSLSKRPASWIGVQIGMTWTPGVVGEALWGVRCVMGCWTSRP